MDCGFNINHILPDEMTIVDSSADFWKNTSVGGGRQENVLSALGTVSIKNREEKWCYPEASAKSKNRLQYKRKGSRRGKGFEKSPPDYEWAVGTAGAVLEFLRQEISTIIDRIGEGSAQMQGLLTPITSSAKLRASDHKLYILKDAGANAYRGGVIGYIKTARKKLVIYDTKGQKKQYEPVCVLDFFVDPAYQRKGNGARIFDYMLQREHIQAQDIAIDRPSAKCLSFLSRRFNLTDTVKQPSHFVVFTDFFANNTGSNLDANDGGSDAGPNEKFSNGFTYQKEERAADAAGLARGTQVNGGSQKNGSAQSNGDAQNGTLEKASAGTYKPNETDGQFRGALRQTKGPNLHYVHTQLW